ncbi:DNA recombination protein RmuC [Variovorax sp. J2L1-78]|uniref:DNA recombination protein RmuC n=2 Tax=Variovorax arabinosiphilus TaxID=3053498 RepID=UPI0025776F51|nr:MULTISPECIES: DNA recombination protein RmuC [unclassified Variovorax]MDM0120225.1 DNA recombination protein RmuC [Variovorax sp. J2L1-78]MDM0127863.1 DNA recombination protein RmuC [Variovorax sp. J2L1-63]MDM0231562.1 DNA recombination protein RmuC [Variovorax sp. J2R1-6]
MSTAEIGLWILLGLAALTVILLVALLMRRPAPDRHAELLATLADGTERSERALRQEVADSARSTRQELGQNFASFQAALVQQGAEATRTQNAQIDAFAQQLTLMQKTLADTLNTQLQGLSESNARRLAEVRTTMETQLAQLQQTNTAKLDEMRKTVDEKLQSTLEARLGESFKQVADRLDQVHKGLGEMQTLAIGVGSLQRVLTNVKTRGVFGEVQLEALLEQVLTTEQYAKQVETKPRSGQRVDFAVRFPGRSADGAPVWLPIDAKFPRDDYERLIDAHERADVLAVEVAGKALEARIRSEAKSIADNYLAAPHTTDFAILFLPVESLYAEVLRRPGLMDAVQRQHRVTLAGPTTLLAMLNSLHMGFRTLALEQQASEVWKVLGAVKTEFNRFGEWVERIKEQVAKASDTIDKADTRQRQMRRALKGVEALPELQAQALLPAVDPEDDGAL